MSQLISDRAAVCVANAPIGRTLVERAGHADLHDVNSMLNFTRQSRRCLIGGVQRALIRTDVQD